MGLRDQIKKMQDDLINRHKESQERSEEYAGGTRGTIFLKDKVPEGYEFWEPKPGDHLIDIIPFIAGKQHPRDEPGYISYVVDLWVHRYIGPGQDMIPCTMSNFGTPDPICSYIKSNRVPTDEWKKIAPKRRCVYLVWVHDTAEEEEKGIQIWEVAHWNFEKHIDEISKNPRTGEPIPFSHIEQGRSIAFSIKKSGKFESDGQEFDSLDWVGHRLVERDEPIPDEVIDQSFSVDEIVNMFPDEDQVKTSFFGSAKAQTKEPEQEEQSEPAAEGGRLSKLRSKKGLVKPKPTQEAEEPKDDNPCPHGYEFGVDIEKKEECSSCKVWDDCSAEAERRLKKEAPEPEPKEEAPADEQPKRRIIRRVKR